jgi:hypothetical protein
MLSSHVCEFLPPLGEYQKSLSSGLLPVEEAFTIWFQGSHLPDPAAGLPELAPGLAGSLVVRLTSEPAALVAEVS